MAYSLQQDYKQKLVSYDGGCFMFQAGGEEFPCSTFQMTMRLNDIAGAVVHVDMGVSIKDGTVYNPEQLLSRVMGRERSDNSAGLVPCTVICIRNKLRFPVFNGYISSGELSYSAMYPPKKYAVFRCMAPQCMLMDSPLSAYVEAGGGDIVDRLTSSERISAGTAMTRSGFYLGQRTDIAEAVSSLSSKLEGRTVAERCGILLEMVRLKSSFKQAKDMSKEIDADKTDLVKYLGGKTYLNKDMAGMDKDVAFAWDAQMAASLANGMLGGSIWSALYNVLRSTEYMLSLIPRVSLEEDFDFKMDVRPSTAWKTGGAEPLALEAGDILSIKMKALPLSVLSTPDVFIVNFSSPCPFNLNDEGKDRMLPGGVGVACSDPKMQAKLRSASSVSELGKMLEQCKTYRTKEFDAPQWLHAVAPAALTKGGGKGEKSELRTPDTTEEAQESEKNTYELDKAVLDSVANEIAEALLVHFYMSQDSVDVHVSPDLFFGSLGLENRIGETLELDLLTGQVDFAWDTVSSLALRGVLECLDFEYVAGEATSSRYVLTLSHVRPADAKVPEVECPMYKVEENG